MFATDETTRLFGLPPGADFPAQLLAGLRARLDGAPPEAMARVRLYLPTRRMARRLTDLLMRGDTASFLPRIGLVSDLASGVVLPGARPPVPALRRKLELAHILGGRGIRRPPQEAG